jgi:hypothetical protein
MARLTEEEKAELRRPWPRHEIRPPTAPRLSFLAFLEFATFASRFQRGVKPVRFTGKYWRI